MHKLKKALWVLLAALSLCSAAYGAEAPDLTELSAIMSDSVISLTLESQNLPSDAKVFAAGYDADGRLLAISPIADKSAVMTDNNITRVKAFCWDSNVSPLCSAVSTAVVPENTVKISCVVTNTYLQDAAVNEYDPQNNNIELTLTKTVSDETKAMADLIDFDLSKGSTVTVPEGGSGGAKLLGYACTAYIGLDKTTDKLTLYAIEANSCKNTVTSMHLDQLAKEGDKLSNSELLEANACATYYWKNYEADLYPTPLFLNLEDDTPAVTVIADFENIDFCEIFSEVGGIMYMDNMNYDRGYVDFIDNDSDGDYDFVIITSFVDESVVGSINMTDEAHYDIYDLHGLHFSYIDLADRYVVYIFEKDGKTVDISAIAHGDTVTQISSENGSVNLFKISSEKVLLTKCSRLDTASGIVTVNNKDYRVSPFLDVYLRDIWSAECSFYINTYGDIAFIDGNITSMGSYGYLAAVDTDTQYDTTTYSALIVDEQGYEHIFDLPQRVRVYDYSNEFGTDCKCEEVFNILSILADSSLPYDHIIKYTLDNHGKLEKLWLASEYQYIEVDHCFHDEYNAENNKFVFSDPFSETAMVFCIKKPDEGYDLSQSVIYEDGSDKYCLNDANLITVGSVDDFFNDGECYNVYTFAEGSEIACVIATGLEKLNHSAEDPAEPTNYGYIAKAQQDSLFNKQDGYVQLIDSDGKLHTYKLDSKVRVFSGEDTEGTVMDSGDVYGLIHEAIYSDIAANRIFKYSAYKNKIVKLVTAADYKNISLSQGAEQKYDASSMTLGGQAPFSYSSPVFALDSNYDLSNTDKIIVGSANDIFSNGGTYNAVTFTESGEAKAAIVFDTKIPIDLGQNVFVVSGVSVDYDKDGNAMLTLTGIQDGKTRTVTLYNEDDSTVAEDYIDNNGACTFTKGTVVLLGKEIGGYVANMEILVTVTRDGNYLDRVTVTGNELDEYVINGFDYVYYGYGEVTAYESRKAQVDGYTDEYTGYEVMERTNVVLVDFTSTRIPTSTVKASNRSGLTLGTGRNPYAVNIFFRTSNADSMPTEKFNLKDNRRAINDIVIYRVMAEDADKLKQLEKTPKIQ